MPTPSGTLSTQRPDLETFWEISFAQIEGMMISSTILPTINPSVQAGTYGKKTLESIARHDSDIDRAPGSGYKRRRYEFTTDSFATTEKGIEEVLDDREVAIYRNYTAAEEFATARAVHTCLIEKERRCAETVIDVAFYTGYAAGFQAPTNGLWNTAAATPVDDVELAYRKVRDATGVKPNALVLPFYGFRDLRNCPQILDRISASGAGDRIRARDVNINHLREIFDIEHVLVGDTLRNSANPGATAVMGDVWPDHAFVTVVAETDDPDEPCIGRTIHYSEDGSTLDGTIESYREENKRSSIYRARHDYQLKIKYQELGCLITNIR